MIAHRQENVAIKERLMNDKELMDGLERSNKDVKESRIYELKNVDDLDEIREDLIILHNFEHRRGVYK